VLFSLYSYGLCLFLTPLVNSSPNNRSVIGAVATATAADCVQQHFYGGLSAGASSWFGQASLSCVIGRVALCLSCRRDVLARVLSFFVVPFFCFLLLPLLGMGRWYFQWVSHLFLCCHARVGLFVFIECCSSVGYRVPLLFLFVFSFFSTLSPWLDCCASSNGRCVCFVSTLRHRTVTLGKACDMLSRHGSSETPQAAVQATQSC